jgi:hypothetical protein
LAWALWDEAETGREQPEEAILILAGRHVWHPPETLRGNNSVSFLTQRRKGAGAQGIGWSEWGLSAVIKERLAPVPADNIRISAVLRLCGFVLSSGCIGMAGRVCASCGFLLPGDRWFRFKLFIPLCIGGQRVSVAGATLSVGHDDGSCRKLACMFDSIFQLSGVSLSLAPAAWLARPIQIFKLTAAGGVRWRLAEGCDVHILYIALRKPKELYGALIKSSVQTYKKGKG